MRLCLTVLLLLCLLVGGTNAQSACPLAPRLTTGQRGSVLGTSPNNLREGPNRDETIITEIPGGAVFEVLAGPECDGGIHWWQVDYAGQVGWTAEGDSSTYFVEPVHPALLYKKYEFNSPIGEDGRDDLILHDLVTGESKTLTADIPYDENAENAWRLGQFAWTPEFDRIAFTVEIYVPFHEMVDTSVYLMNADGSGKCVLEENARLLDTGSLAIAPPRLEEEGEPFDFPPCENPPEMLAEGWRIEIDQQNAFAVNLETGERIQLTDETMGDATFNWSISPDETVAAIRVLGDDYESTLYLIPLANPDEAAPVELSHEPTGPLTWSPDGQFLLVAGKNMEENATLLMQVNVETGEEQILYTGISAVLSVEGPVYSPSGGQIAFTDAAKVEPVGEWDIAPRLYLMNADGSDLRQINTLDTHGPILWRPE